MASRRTRRFFNEVRNRALIGATTGAVRLLLATLRYRDVGRAEAEAAARAAGGCVYVFWHDGIIIGLGHPVRKGSRALISPTKDGDFAARIVRHFGVDAVRGSTNKHPLALLRRCLRMRSETPAFSVTPDGPRGPRHVFAPGAAWLAARLGWPVIPIGLAVSRCWRLRSWDLFRIPKPFARAAVCYGPPLVPDRAAATDELVRVLSSRLEAAEARARELVARPSLPASGAAHGA